MRIAIVGGGYSGVAVAINILRRSLDEILLTLIERTDTTGQGAAYGTKRREHVLNVPAGKMSALPDVPDHLLKWLELHEDKVGMTPKDRTPKSFVPREIYSRYLKSTLQEEARQAKKVDFREIHDEAVEVHMLNEGTVQVGLASGKQLEADRVVLCLGNEKSLWPCGTEEAPSERLIGNPWAIEPQKIDKHASVLIVGTGLSMADVVVSLAHHGHEGKVTAISRRGIIPKSHDTELSAVDFQFPDKKRTALELSYEIMERIAHHTSLGGDWREAFDGIRPHTVSLWKSLSPEEQQMAVKKDFPPGKAVWDVHRHRVAPEIHEALKEFFMRGDAEVVSAHLVGLGTSKEGKVKAMLDLGKNTQEREYDFVVNCTGPNQSVTKSSNPFMQSLLNEGLVLPGSSGLGTQVAESSRIIGKNGESKCIWAVGPQLMDRDFESIAVPELREQALVAAKAVLESR